MKTRHPEPSFSRLSKGFALVVTLTLMVLLSILALGLLSLSSVALRTSGSSQAMAEARANARLALQLAIGQLQTELGPDQRISASAELLEAGKTPHSTRKFWTATYDSWPSGTTTRPTPVFRKWLTSGDPATLANRGEAESAPPSDSVTLFSDGTETVSVPKIASQKPGSKGSLAWWTSDNNLKATLTPAPENTDPGAPLRQLAMSGGNGGLPLLTPNGSTPYASVITAGLTDNKAITLAQTALLVGAEKSTVPSAFPHLTTHGSGLLVNVRDGGFRKDLSIYLERDFSEIPDTPLYTVGGSGGINMKELWAFHQLPTRLQSGYTVPFTTGGTPSASEQFIVSKTGQSGILGDPFFRYPQPTPIRFQTILSFYSNRAGGTDETPLYKLYLVTDPIVTVWNPFDVAISFAGVWNTVKFWQLPYDFVIREDGGQSKRLRFDQIAAQNGDNFMRLRVGRPDDIVLRPGEVAVYSQADGGSVKIGLGDSGRIDSKKGWNLGSGVGWEIKNVDKSPYLVSGNTRFTYKIEANGASASGSKQWGLTMNDYWIYESNPGGPTTASIPAGAVFVDWIDGNPSGRLKATDTEPSRVFNKISTSTGRELTVSQLSEKEPVMVYSYAMKTEKSSDLPSRFSARNNPKALFFDFQSLDPGEREAFPWEIKVEPLDSWFSPFISTASSGIGYFGADFTAQDGSNRVITHSVPREHPVSLATFQHSISNGLDIGGTGSALDQRKILLPGIGHAIGNSLASSIIPKNQTESSLTGNRPLADHSYLANLALWDDWFLSGIAPQTYSSFSSSRSKEQVAQDFFEGKKTLPVSRYKADLGNTDATDLVSEILAQPSSDPEKFTGPAAHIQVKGMFNVNSTSVSAWKAVLASLRNTPGSAQTNAGGDASYSSTDATPVSNLLSPLDSRIDPTTLGDHRGPNQWIGHRALEDDEIDFLAEAIVTQIKKRGPFLSLADFVNRRVGSDSELAAAGAIQAALDDPASGVNKDIANARRVTPDATRGLAFPDAETGAASYGTPGYVKQADILTPIAPWISVRSDSFTIRAYGESIDKTGTVTRAWCEATVERTPDYIDPADARTVLPSDLQSNANKTFGRRFQIVSFRWMNESEIL